MSLRGQPATRDEVAALVAEVADLRREVAELKRRPFKLAGFSAHYDYSIGVLELVSDTTGFSSPIARHA